ncbi:benzoyl-CoA-dihydrodiol lyase [Pseudonocardia sp. KRD-184]|uniref:Benzoyl-CoA-dihydrodiol lyase n=1 Tax=Pseudonocardia oceani TaxID=2792013 RepID=A0ABS6UCL8_9PSEU|nr:2,3-epoxybenzoyl-CoA dihydrolase [Pseudonocardia oceani]MBW0092584.1 benzoyl-CoA-dihydrodiol lyase [Pseudonocardia oceani]MBW0097279.1 benzoyl-CoA-dihydrodiol lyase [Pseudonocardia oceani]MBW0107895.1 benzoyl-CoA-dihydrodiol lyase [Pseudonocardia oceani]MBW0121269.1 benzoyl-CoA-dihydrodiol lyase [Pseudonocardia oceani]MBW0129962.1 benzoyl-CoA-dihydrodiol lyase [Pseudonocardia oceani]
MTTTADPDQAEIPTVSFDREPSSYRHWKLDVQGEVAYLRLDIDEAGGIVGGYELKMNSYDLGVDIELYDATQRLRFEHPGVKAVVLTSAKDRNFCAGANIRMLAQSSHPWKVNFCKFTNETRNGIEDATANSGQTWIAALNGTAAGGGYEMALACEQILLIDDNSSAVSLPEVPLLGVLPGTGGLTRVIDKRRVRKDRADVFATKSEGARGKQAVEWKLVDEVIPKRAWDETVAERAATAAAASTRPSDATGVALPPLEREEDADGIRYRHVTADFDRDAGLVNITVHGPEGDVPDTALRVHELGAEFWPLAMTRELDDLILRLRANELELGTWIIRTKGDVEDALAFERVIEQYSGSDWLVNEIRHYFKRVLKRLDVTSRSLIALIEPGSCFAGALLELALACDRQYMLDGFMEEDSQEGEPAQMVLSASNFGTFPMSNGLSRLGSRFYGDDDTVAKLRQETGRRIEAAEAMELGLVTDAPDDIDWEDEVRIMLEERASLSPDALTGMEANHRFVGPETMESRIFSRLTAWQNWIFVRPNASGPEGALRKYGTGRKADFDRKRV